MDTSAISIALLGRVSVAFGVLILLGGASLLYYAHRQEAWERKTEGLLTRGRQILARIMSLGESTDADRRFLTELSPRRLVRLVVGLSPSLTGESQAQLGDLARALGMVRRAEESCRSQAWGERLRGARMLTALAESPQLVQSLLRDRHPAVRAQAAELASEHGSPEVAAALVAGLADSEPLVRFAAMEGLLALGPIAVEPLRAALEEGDAPRAALLQVASGIPDARLLPPALRLSGDADVTVRLRAALFLAAVGGPDAEHRLTELLDDPSPVVREAACLGLGLLGHWRAAPEVSRRLADASRDVRREASVALLRMGAPGELFLRRAERETGSGSDMARLALALPRLT